MPEKRARGFAAMDAEQQRRIASMGGRAAHERGTAHEWDSREAAEAGRKGGKAHHRGTARVTSASNGAQNGQPISRSQEGDASVGSRHETNGRNGVMANSGSNGAAAVEPQWSEPEYENRGTPGCGISEMAGSAPGRTQ